MKKPEEYIKEVFESIVDGYDSRGYQISQYDIETMIKKAQIDTWNEAIELAANKAETIYIEEDGCATGDYYDVNKNSILKLKK